jgi:hypothetical protein
MPKRLLKDYFATYGFPFGESVFLAEDVEWQHNWYTECYRDIANDECGPRTSSYVPHANIMSPIFAALEPATNNREGGMKNFIQKLMIRAFTNLDLDGLIEHLSDPDNDWPLPSWVDVKGYITLHIHQYLSCDDDVEQPQRLASVRGY